MLPGLHENGRADCEESWDDFFCPQRGKMCHQIVNDAVQQEKPLIISTPGISPSALLEEVSESDRDNDICSVTPLQRLLKMVNVMSPKALSASISDIGSIVCMTDRVASSAPLNNSKAEIGNDLVGKVTSRLRKRCSIFGGTTGSRRTRHCRSSRMYASSRRVMDCESYDLNSTFTERSRIETAEHSHGRGFSLPFKQSLVEEIRKINRQLIDTVVSLCDKGMITTDTAATIDRSEGIIVECSFAAMRINSNKISQQDSALQLAVRPLKLLVPKGYPQCSPIFNKLQQEACPTDCEDLSFKTREKFNMSVRSLPHPFSISEVASTWDACAREVVSEYAQRNGGGSFSSKYGSWDDCLHHEYDAW